MNTASPLRYPGGKSFLAPFLAQVRLLNDLCAMPIAEPYAGGAGASLSLLFLEEVQEVLINDADEAVHAFWWSLLNRPRQFIDRLSRTRASMTEWRRQRAAYRSGGRLSYLDRGFAAFFLNRCNRSGIIINGGPIGGITQQGDWKVNARFNKPDLAQRCEKVAEFRQRIHLSCDDGIEFIERRRGREISFFIDPPYYEKGETLYMNTLTHEYHEGLASQLKSMSDAAWVLTYDDCPEIRRMYRSWATVRSYRLRYSAAARRSGREVVIVPKWMRLPSRQATLDRSRRYR